MDNTDFLKELQELELLERIMELEKDLDRTIKDDFQELYTLSIANFTPEMSYDEYKEMISQRIVFLAERLGFELEDYRRVKFIL